MLADWPIQAVLVLIILIVTLLVGAGFLLFMWSGAWMTDQAEDQPVETEHSG